MNVKKLCMKVGLSPQAYYKGKHNRASKEINESFILELVRVERQLQPRLGARKLLVLIKEKLLKEGVQIGRDRFFELLRKNDLLVSSLPKSTRTTYSYHSLPVFKNELKEMKLTAPNQAWASDITYLRTSNGFLYLSLITDMYSRKIVGYNAGNSLETQGCLNALDMALKRLPQGKKLIHHSDRGCQYCSHLYVSKLKENGLSVSMTEENHCYENALAERVNGILKQEYYLSSSFTTKKDAIKAVEQAIFLYNNHRPHRSLNYQFPEQVHSIAA